MARHAVCTCQPPIVLPVSVLTKICMLCCCSAAGSVEAVPAWMLFGSSLLWLFLASCC